VSGHCRPGRGRRFFGLLLLPLALLVPAAGLAGDDGVSDLVRQGEYLLRAGGCVSCHTEKSDDGAFLAGGRAIESPFGTFYGPNITPDPETGIGRWSEDDFARALRKGVSPMGRHYYPAFPYTSYTRLRREDIAALWAYLQTVEPVRRQNRNHELVWYAGFRPALRAWKFLHFRRGEFDPRPDASAEWNRGAYLSTALAHCAECHSPRTRTGGLEPTRLYSGTRMAGGDVAPNITPDRETGIGRWRPGHLLRYLDMGMDPDGDFAGSAMADVITEGTSHLTDEDRRALVVYLLALEPIQNRVPPAD
jgi:mono/diheme cytochrome c family protein